MTENKPSIDPKFSRRTFIKGAVGALTAGLLANQLPGHAHASPEGIATSEDEPIPIGWNFPIVEGEVAPEGESLENLQVTIQPTNFRKVAGVNEPTLFEKELEPGSYLIQRSSKIVQKDGYDWLDPIDLVYLSNLTNRNTETFSVMLKGKLPKPVSGAIYKGGVVKAIEQENLEIPEEVLALFGPSNIELPKSDYALAAQDVEQMFSVTGGAENLEIQKQINEAWGDTETTQDVMFSGWKRAAYIAAHVVVNDPDPQSQSVTVADLTSNGNDTDKLNFYTQVNGESNVQVITRLSTNGETVFLIADAEVTKEDDSKKLSFNNIGFTRWEGLQHLLPDSAEEAVSQMTELQGSEALQLAKSVGETKQAKVLLAGLDTNQFAPKLVDTEEGTWRYFKHDGGKTDYRAQLTNNEGEILSEMKYLVSDSGVAEWRKIVDLDTFKESIKGKQIIKHYAKAIGASTLDISDRISDPRIINLNGKEIRVVTDSVTGYPLFLEQEAVWSGADIGIIAEIKGKKVRLAGNLRGASIYKDALAKFNGYSMPDGHWDDPNNSSDLRPDKETFNFSPYDMNMDMLNQAGVDQQFFHLIWGYQQALPDWLIESNYSAEEYKQLAINHIQEVMQYFKGKVSKYVVVNEAWGNPWEDTSRFWMDKLGDPSSWVVDLFKAAHAADPEATLVFNDFGTEIPDSQLWNAEKEPKFFSIAKQLVNEGLPVEAGFQLHVYAKNFADTNNFNRMVENYRAQLQKYISAGIPVNITEFDIWPHEVDAAIFPELKTKISEALVRVSIEEGVNDMTFFGTPGETDRQPLFNTSKEPAEAYYATTKALLES